MKLQLHYVSMAGTCLRLAFNPAKTELRATQNGLSLITADYFVLQGHTLTGSKKNVTKYLGTELDEHLKVLEPHTLINKIKDQLLAIMQSDLKEWQKVDAIRTFILPQLVYGL